MVKRYRNPSHAVGSSPTKSTWMCEKRWEGTGMGCCTAGGWRTTLARLHCWQSATLLCMSLFIAGHTTLAPSILSVALTPGWAMLWNQGPGGAAGGH
jgi:hypothetical protein